MTSFAKITLPSVFADNMVLQQNSDVAIWGWSEPGETIRIIGSWNTQDTISVKSGHDATWRTTMKTKTAGGPYTVEILGSSHILFTNVMLGEVWICSGQSNMEWRANYGIDHAMEEISNANHPNIRIFNIQRMAADYPQQDCFATWKACTPETMRSTSAIAYFFAREINQKLTVPVGIIVSAWGGTPIEVWIKENLVNENSAFDNAKYQERPEHNWPSSPGATYNAMIAPIIPYGIAGALWYQGESNCGTYQVYAELQKTLIENWRSDFKKEFPFYFVQIAPYDYGVYGTSEYLREQQELVSKVIPNTGMVVISDLVDDVKEIHPRNKKGVGLRLANYALAETYNQKVGSYKSPMYKSHQVENNKIRLAFDHVPTGLVCRGKRPVNFLVSGDNKEFVKATAKIEGESIVVYSKLVKSPVAVRFCFDDTDIPNVFSLEGLPLAPFRTDNWDNK